MRKCTDLAKLNKTSSLLAAAAIAGLMNVGPAQASNDVHWNVPPATTNGDYGIGSNWLNTAAPGSPPGSGDQADVSNGGTANISTGETFSTTEIWAGNAMAAGGGSSNLGGTILQTGGTLTTSQWLVVGRFNVSGTYDISGSGVVNQQGNSSGEIQLFGSSTLGQAVFNIHGMAQVTAGGELEVGTNPTSNALLELGDTATLTVQNKFFIGDYGSASSTNNGVTDGTFNMTGGTLNDTSTANLVIGRQGGTGVWNLSGGTVTKSDSTGDFIIGSNANASGAFTSTGTLTISGTGSLTTSNQIWIGENNNQANCTTNGVLNVSAGTLTANNWIAIGRDGSGAANATGTSNGTINLSGTGVITETATVGGANVTFAGKTNTINQTGGTFNNTASLTYMGEDGTSTWNISSGLANLGQVQLCRNSGTTGTINLNGGIFSTTQIIQNASGTATVNFNGGTLQANKFGATTAATAFMTGLTAANVQAGGAVIDTNTQNITIGQALLHSGTTDGGLTKNGGTGTLTLSGANTYTGPTTINVGTLAAGVASVANTSGAFGKNSAVTLANVASASMNITGFNTQIGSLAGGGTTGGNVTLGGATLTLGADNTNPAPYAGSISGTGGVTKIGTGIQTFSGSNNYSGNTAINAGVLNVTGSLASTASVNSGGTLMGVGNNSTTGVVAGAVTVNGGGTIATTGLSGQAFSVNGIALGNASTYDAADYATLNITATGTSYAPVNIGPAGTPTGTLTLNSSGAYVPIAGITSPGTYTLMNFGSQTGTGIFSLSPTTSGVNSLLVGRTTYTLSDNPTSLVLSVVGAPTPGVAYFNGGAGSSIWNDTSNASFVNWSTDLAGATDAGNIPAAPTDVILAASNQTGTVATTLGANTIINSLNVNSSAASNAINADGHTLTINALADSNTASDASYTGNPAGRGIFVASGANGLTVNVPVVLGGSAVSQTWTNASASALTVNGNVTGTGGLQTLTVSNTSTGNTVLGGAISDSGAGTVSLTVNSSGSGKTILTGASTYSGITTITAGTLQLGDNTSGHDGVNTNSSQIMDNGALVFNRIGSTSYSGVISGLGTVSTNGSGTLTLTNSELYSGVTTINAGTLQLGDGSSSHDGNIAGASIVDNAALAFDRFGSSTYGGVISGNGTVSSIGGGTQILTGANIYNGTTTISAGTLQLGDGTSGHDGSIAGASIVDSATLAFNRFGSSTYAGVISGTGIVAMNSGTQVLSAAQQYSGATNINGGTLQLGSGLTTGSLNTLSTITDNGTLAIDRSNAVAQGTDFSPSAISGTGGLHLMGTGTTTLTAGNTYTGDTVVSNGNLVVSGGIGVGAHGIIVNTPPTPNTPATPNHLYVGDTAGQSASISFPTGSTGTFYGGDPGVILGSTGTASGTMSITGGTVYSDSEFWVSNGSGAYGELDISSGSLTVNNWIAIGRTNGTAVVNLSGTGSITKTTSSGPTSNITFAGNSGILNQSGGTLTAIGSQLYLGEVNGSSGTWNFSGGSSNINDARIGIGSGAVGVLTQTGTSSYTADYTTIAPGTGSTGTWSLSSGTAALNNPGTSLYVGEFGTGTLTIGGTGVMTVAGNVSVGTNPSANATLNLNTGGSMTAFQLTRGTAATVALNGNGGTLSANAANPTFLQGFTTSDAHLNAGVPSGPGGLTINSAGYAIASNSSFNGTGPFTKTGSGTLTLSGTQAYSGTTTVSAGTLQLSHQVFNNSVLAPNTSVSATNSAIAGYYPFNPASYSAGTYADTSGNGNTLTDVYGSTTVSASGPNAHLGSITFSMNSPSNPDYLTISPNGTAPANFPTGNSSYTLAAWVNLDGTNGGSNGIVGWGNYGNSRQVNALKIFNNGGSVANYWWAADLQPNVGSSLNGNWHYVAATYNATTDVRTLYVDGTAIGTDSPGADGSTSANFAVGVTNNLSEYFSGSMSSLLIANSALTQAQLVNAAANGVSFGTYVSDGLLSPTSTVAIASGATLDLGGTVQQTTGGLSDSGGGGGTVTSSVANPTQLNLAPTGTKSFSGGIQNGSGTVSVTMAGPGTQVLSGSNTYSGGTNVTGGTLAIESPTALPTASVLSISSGATVVADRNGGGRITLDLASLANSGTINLKDNRLVIHNINQATADATTAAVFTQLHNGFAGGTWAGGTSPSILSSVAAGSSLYTLGEVESGTDVKVNYAYYGDADLSGIVDGTDYSLIDAGFGSGGTKTGWQNGDFNYDGHIDGSDYSLIDNAFNTQTGSAPAVQVATNTSEIAGGTGSAVPEPGSLSLIGIGAAGLLSRRRRK
jgi:fibronectin-binding autotransporter adhesin